MRSLGPPHPPPPARGPRALRFRSAGSFPRKKNRISSTWKTGSSSRATFLLPLPAARPAVCPRPVRPPHLPLLPSTSINRHPAPDLATHVSIGQTIRLSRDVSVSTQAISAGAAFQFPAHGTQTRVCTMIAGKLKVEVDGEKEFTHWLPQHVSRWPGGQVLGCQWVLCRCGGACDDVDGVRDGESV